MPAASQLACGLLQYTRIQTANLTLNLRLAEVGRNVDILKKNWKAHFEGQETDDVLNLQKLTDGLLASQRETKLELEYIKEQIAKLFSQLERHFEKK